MASCLGLFIESNLIKYAKVSKEHDMLRVEAFGIEFYDNLDATLKQIIEETYSYKTPISINLSDEMYTYFNVFSLLGKNYLPKVIKTEFDSYCAEKGYNPSVFETRYALVDNVEEDDKIRVINVSANKIELSRRITELEAYKLTTISPLSMAITNIANLPENENALIVNMEEDTTVTTITKQKIYNIEVLDEGSSDILNRIEMKENSFAKAYEACKNTTIYTVEGKELADEQSYLDDVMPTVNKIASQIRSIIDSSLVPIKRVYLTGTLTCINNIDLFFQECLPDVECLILKPNFITLEGNEINIREYIEVNSAIALGIQGLDIGVTGMNFKTNTLLDSLNIKAGSSKGTEKKSINLDPRAWFKLDLGQRLTITEKRMLRSAIGLLILLIVYSGLSMFLTSGINKKEQEVNDLMAKTEEQIELAKSDKGKIDQKANEYKEMTKALEDLSDRVSDANKSRNIIPHLLNQIMYVIPKNVQITSIENTQDKHVVILAQSDKYEPLGYFKAKLNSDSILYNVVSDSGVNENGTIKVTIEGDLQ